MRYACFRPLRGTYDYFEDASQTAINADLPVPRFGAPTPVGVAAIDAARPFPSGARPIGHGWHATGIVVRCPDDAAPLGSVESLASDAWTWTRDGGWKWILAGAVAGWVVTRI